MRFIGSTSSGTVNFPLRIHLSIGGRTGSSTVGTVRLGPAATSATPSEGSAVTTPDKNDRFGRRELLQRGALAGLGVSPAPPPRSPQPARRAGGHGQSLRRLRTDYVDVYFNHAVNDVERLKNPEWHEFTARAKQQGKIRFVGMSGHAGRLIQCLDYALDTNGVDVILVAYNFGQDPAFYQGLTRSFDFIARQADLPR